MKEFADFVKMSNNSDFAPTPTWNDAVSLVESIPSAEPETNGYQYGYNQGFIDGVKHEQEKPSAQPERKKGRWIAHGIEEGNAFAVYTCSECGVLVGINTSNFCPNCGAEMEKGES